jgi:hypothetical protein
VEKTAELAKELKIISKYRFGRDARGRKTLSVIWLNKPEGLDRRRRRTKRPPS